MFEGFDGWLRVSDTSGEEKPYGVAEFVDYCNMVLDHNLADVLVEGEVASFKVNQGKWVFFDLKEDDTSIGCFMVLSQLKTALTDGMKVRVRATPKLTRWGKFSLTVNQVMPVGEGSIKKSFELLKKKLTAEGLFDPARKRPIPSNLSKIGVISSTGAAGYIDFLKILDNRWGGLNIQTINTQVQGMAAPEQIIRALDYFNQKAEVDAIIIVRGGGSADDLAAFNDESLARAIAASRIPVMTGIGHEVDESLADLAADVRASTPSNAAERLVPDRHAISLQTAESINGVRRTLLERISHFESSLQVQLQDLRRQIISRIEQDERKVQELQKLLVSLNPENVLKRGYAIISGKISPGQQIELITHQQLITAEVIHVQERN